MKTKDISLTLKAVFLPEDQNCTLEDLLKQLFAASPKLSDRMLDVDFYSQIIFSGLDAHPQNRGVFLRAYIIENQAVGLIDTAATTSSVDLMEMLPPAGHKFLKREVVLYILGDKILSFGMGKTNSQFSRLISNLLQSHLKMQGFLSIEDVPRKTTLAELKEVGVKSIDLSVTDYMESLPGARALPPVMRAIFASPLNKDDALKRAKSVGSIHLSRGRALRSEKFLRDEYLTGVGESILESDTADGFKIILENGRTLTSKSFKVSKTYRVQTYANSVSYPHVREALMAFARELEEQGMLG